MSTIVELHLHAPASFYPGWHPGLGGSRDQYAFYARNGYEIVREGDVYVVSHTREVEEQGVKYRVTETCEVPVARAKAAIREPVRSAVDQPAPKPQALAAQGRRR